MSTNAVVPPEQFHTVAVFLKGATDYRVLVDKLGGSEAEAIETALAIVSGLGRKEPAELIARVIATTPITEV